VRRLDRLIDDLNAEPLAFVVHLGDIGSSRLACTDDWIAQRKIQFRRIRHLFVLLPGDNEWSDCRDPEERLRAWRRAFCDFSFPRTHQSPEFCEHLRWEADGMVFVTLNVQGSNNNVGHAEHGPRMRAVHAWLDEAARLAESRLGLVVMMQANPFVTFPRDGFADLREKLIFLSGKLKNRIVLVHGDTHVWRDDEPLPGLRRVEVWGSPFVSFLQLPLEGGRLGPSYPRHR
jgi:hypothetical protein